MGENGTLKTLGLLFAGFVAGFGTSQFISRDSIFASSEGSCPTEDWQKKAKEADWIERAECPAYPLQLSITSPGDQTLALTDTRFPTELREKLVVKFSRPVPESQDLHIASQVLEAQNLYISSGNFSFSQDRTTASAIGSTNLNQRLSAGQTMKIWAVLADHDTQVGDIYRDIEQLRANVGNTYISEPVTLKIGQLEQ